MHKGTCLLRAVRLFGFALAKLKLVGVRDGTLREDGTWKEAGRVEDAEDTQAEEEGQAVEAVDVRLVCSNNAVETWTDEEMSVREDLAAESKRIDSPCEYSTTRKTQRIMSPTHAQMFAQKTTFQASKSWRLKMWRTTKPGEREKVPSERCQATGYILRL